MYVWASMLAAFFISLLGCWLIASSTLIRKLVSVDPAHNRWHQYATPGLGGVPIFLALALGVLLHQESSTFSVAILTTAFLLMLLGAIDDLVALAPKAKLVGQLAAALLALILIVSQPSNSVIYVYHLVNLSDNELTANLISLFYWCVCIGWIIAITNAINLMDNMDGAAGGVSLIACIAIALITRQSPELTTISNFYLILSASLAGFLLLNCNPAKLFMGDAGALWIGLVVAIGALIAAPLHSMQVQPLNETPTSYFWLIPLVICAVPISDTAMVIITRKLRGQPASQGGSDHLSHRLVCLGLSQRIAVAVLWFAAATAASIAVLINTYPIGVWLIPLCIFLIALALGVIVLTNLTCAPDGKAIKKSELNSI